MREIGAICFLGVFSPSFVYSIVGIKFVTFP